MVELVLKKPLAAGRKPRNPYFVYSYLRPFLGGLVLATVLALILGLVSALVAALIGPSLQIMAAPKDEVLTFEFLLGQRLGSVLSYLLQKDGLTAKELLDKIPWALLVLAVLKGILSIWQWFLWERASERAAQGVRADLFRNYLRTDPSQRRDDEARSAEATLSSAITTDVKMMREYIVRYYGGLPRELLQSLFLCVMLIVLSPKLFAIFVLGVVPALAFALRIGKKLRRRAARALEDYSTLTEWLQQRLLGVETIKHYRTEELEARNMQSLTATLNDRFLKAARVKARTSPILEAMAVVSMVIVLLIAIRDVQSGVTSGSIQLSFFSTLALLSQSAGKLGRYFNVNREGVAAIDRLQLLMTSLTQRQAATAHLELTSAPGPARISFEAVTAVYPGQAAPALWNFTYDFKGGRVYCLAGPSGAGKSTIVNLILGLLRPASGVVRLHAPDEPSSWPIVYMPQKIQLVQDTLAANVAYPDMVIDTAKAEEALRRVGLAGLLDGLSEGLETVVGEGGTGVSGGQAQRILLARLWYHRKPFVLVDEGTSALDPEVEQVIYMLLKELAASGSVVVTIAHRQSAKSMADELLILSQGRLVASGKPEDVIASENYRRILS